MLRILCPAKVNLFLAIQGKDSSGYHLLDTVFMRTRLFQDELTLERADEFSFHCPTLPAEGNSVVKALEVLQAHTGRRFKYRVTLQKGIPPGSGLGGASSDAASLLLALNDLEDLKLSQKTLLKLGAEVGMDVPFFLSGYSMAHGTHYGEIVEPLALPVPNIEIGFTGISVSTQEAFAEWDRRTCKSNAPAFSPTALHNDFEQIFPDLSFKKPNTVLTGTGGAYVNVLDQN